jgi:hypothetical protein
VAQAKEEADAIVAATHAEAEAARARIAKLLVHAQREAAFAAMMARQKPSARSWTPLDQREELIAFEAACAEKKEHLQALCWKEEEIFSARAREMQELTDPVELE